jgi:tetratricopeptide (TPR) repeat protein
MMKTIRSSGSRALVISVVMGLAVVSTGAQARVGAAAGVVEQVRLALGHGDVAGARRAAEADNPDATGRELAIALVEIFEGKYTAARTRLVPLADRGPAGEAALELGLLDVKFGRTDEGRRRLNPIVQNRTFVGPDDYFKLARAAVGVREFLLANDAYLRIKDEKRADIQGSWGDLFLERHQPGDAVTSYRAALEADPSWMPALAGLARALADEDPAESKTALAAAAKVAPDYPDALLLLAEAGLGEEDVAAATQALDRLAKVRPGTIEEAAARMAVAYKSTRGDLAAVDALAARVREINPRSALGYRTAGAEAAREYRFDDAVTLAGKAVAIDGYDAMALFDLGLYLTRTGDEPAARTALERSRELDRSASQQGNQGGSARTNNVLKLLDTLDSFVRVLDGDFIFKFAPEEAAVLRVYALPIAQEAYKTFSERYGFKPQGPLLVEIFPVHDDFAVRTLGLAGLQGALGACFGRVVTMDSPRARPPGEFSWQATLWHEIAHVFSLQASQYRVPRWLTEGISTYEEHRKQPAWGRELTLEYANQLAKSKTFGVKGLPDAFKRPESLSLAYFEASLVVEHLIALNGDAGLRTLLKAYADGASDTTAFASAFGKSVDEVETSFKAFIDERYSALRAAMQDPPTNVEATDVAALRTRAAGAPGNFLSQWSLGQALVRAGDMAAARAPLERAAELAPQASGATSPRALLARMSEEAGDVTRARREWRELLTYDHTNVVAARRLASLSAGVGAAAADDENFALRRVADLDPFDADIHGLLGRRLVAKGQHAEALIEFEAALALGPTNLAEAHADVGDVLLKLGRREEAKREALSALKEAPTFARAQDLLLAAIGRPE